MTKYLLFLMILVFVFYGAANADFYKWEDETGTVHITDYPPPETKSSKNVEVHKYQDDNTSISKQEEEEQEAPFKDSKSKKNKKPEVILYTKDDCKDCDNAREFLKSKKISFKEYNMDKDKGCCGAKKRNRRQRRCPLCDHQQNSSIWIFGKRLQSGAATYSLRETNENFNLFLYRNRKFPVDGEKTLRAVRKH